MCVLMRLIDDLLALDSIEQRKINAKGSQINERDENLLHQQLDAKIFNHSMKSKNPSRFWYSGSGLGKDKESVIHEDDVTMENLYREDHQEHEVNSPQTNTVNSAHHQQNIASNSNGTTITRKETRALSANKKSIFNQRKLGFEIDDYEGHIVGDDSQTFIPKGGCVVRECAVFDGSTWKKQPDLYPTKEEATTHPPNGVKVAEWVLLCDRFANEEFQKIATTNKKNRACNEVPPTVGTKSVARRIHMKRKRGKDVTAIGGYKIAHYSKKKKAMINDKANEIWRDLQNEEASSSCTLAEICMEKLGHIPGHIRGRSASTKHEDYDTDDYEDCDEAQDDGN
ncbi:Myb domain protein 62 [Tanacetum coccineum]